MGPLSQTFLRASPSFLNGTACGRNMRPVVAHQPFAPAVVVLYAKDTPLTGGKTMDCSASDHELCMRPMTARDYPAVLRINEENVSVLSPLDGTRLALIHAMASVAEVFTLGEDGGVVGFLLALRPGTAYDSPNYGWFCDRYDDFLYIDRIVMDPCVRGRGLGKTAYCALFDFARDHGIGRLVAEIDSRPPNGPSLSFHRAMGFVEVGGQELCGGAKEVVYVEARA